MFNTIEEAIEYRTAGDMLLTVSERDALSEARIQHFGSVENYLTFASSIEAR